VGNDNAMRLGSMVIDIPEGARQRGYAKGTRGSPSTVGWQLGTAL
jgi:hypothetical protein